MSAGSRPNDPPPRLLHVFSTFVAAGPEMRTVRLIEALGQRFEHAIVAMDGRTSAAERLSAGAPVRILEAPPKAGSPATVRRLRALLGREQPDLLLTYNWGAFDAVLAGRSRGLRAMLHHEDGFNSDEVEHQKLRRVWTRRLVLPGVHRVVVPSRRLLAIARERWGLRSSQVELVPNGVDLSGYVPSDSNAPLRAHLGIPAEALVIGYVGHLRPEKNPLRLLAACAHLPAELPWRALILGEGPERAALERRASEPPLAGRVHLVGHQDHPPDFYRAMDLFALSSDTEQLPMALLEAMAAGLAVASTAVGDVAHVLPPEQRPLVVPLDGSGDGAAALGAALLSLARDPALRARLGGANRAHVEREYTFEAMLTRYEGLYRAAIAARRPGARRA